VAARTFVRSGAPAFRRSGAGALEGQHPVRRSRNPPYVADPAPGPAPAGRGRCRPGIDAHRSHGAGRRRTDRGRHLGAARLRPLGNAARGVREGRNGKRKGMALVAQVGRRGRFGTGGRIGLRVDHGDVSMVVGKAGATLSEQKAKVNPSSISTKRRGGTPLFGRPPRSTAESGAGIYRPGP